MKVSALTQIHNRIDLFSETVRSVLDQSYPVYEFIIIDDGSTENVRELVESFNDPRLKYYRYKRIGVISKLRNIALSKAGGDVMAFIDSDDLWHKDKIKLHVEDMISSGCAISFSDCRLFDDKGWIGPRVCDGMRKENVDIFRELTLRNQTLAFGTNLLFRRLVDNEELRFDEKLFIGEHDLITLCSARHKATYIDQVLNYIRRHDRNTSKENSIIAILSPLEYNHTARKLFGEKRISKKLFHKIKADNYSKVALAYLNRQRYRTSMRYLITAIGFEFKWSYLRFLFKLTLRRLNS